MGQFYTYETRISAYQAGLLSQCKPSGMLDLLQEAAGQAACEFQATGPEMKKKYNALWMVTRTWYHLDRPLRWNDRVTVKTWHRGDKGAMLYRDFDLYLDGSPIGEAVSIWVAADVESRRLLRFADVPEVAASGGGELCKDRKLKGLHLPGDMVPAGERTFRYSDTDSNGHVNNIHYADLAADAISLEKLLPGHFVSDFQIGYLHECMAGETIGLSAARTEEGYFVRGSDSAGISRFDAHLTLDILPG